MDEWAVAAIIIYSVVAFGFVVDFTTDCSHRWKDGHKWVPDVFRREACLRPLYPLALLWPAILWPVVLAFFLLCCVLVGLVEITKGLWPKEAPRTICGMPICRPEGVGRERASSQAVEEIDLEAQVSTTAPKPQRRPRVGSAVSSDTSSSDPRMPSTVSSDTSSSAPRMPPPAYATTATE